MYADDSDIEILTQLQFIDRDLAKATREFEALPQRQAILDVRAKLAEFTKRKVAVQGMIDEAEEKLAKLAAEDERLDAKEQEARMFLTRAHGDYRTVEAHSRDLNGIQKRRKAIGEELEGLDAQMAKIQPVMAQVMKLLETLQAQERQQIESFQKEGGALQKHLAEGKAARAAAIAQLNPAVAKEYEEAARRCGGVAVTTLHGESCGACRTHFPTGKLVAVKAQAPLAKCPHCHRLMIIAPNA
jgi:predicted  nucleic acid-binding Zn-ribbon protein